MCHEYDSTLMAEHLGIFSILYIDVFSITDLLTIYKKFLENIF